MTSFAALLKNDIKLFLKDWKACVLLLAAPLFFIAFFTYALTPLLNKSSFIEPFPIALVDNENTAQTRMIGNQLMNIGIFSEIIQTDEHTAMLMLSEKKVGGVIIIPDGFTGSISRVENKPVSVVGSSAMPLQAYVVKNVAESAANLVSAAQSAVITIYHYDKEAGITTGELDERYNDEALKYIFIALDRLSLFSETDKGYRYDVSPAEYFTAALITVFMLFAGMPGMKMMVMERSSGISKRLRSTPVKMRDIVLSKLIVSILLLILQFGTVIVLTSVFFKNHWGAPAERIFMHFGAIILAACSWSVFVAAVSPTPASADITGSLGIILMAVAGGSIYPLYSMPRLIRSISVLTINKWAMDGFLALFSGDYAAYDGIYSLVPVAMSLVLFTASVMVLKFSRSERG
ncbi:MAG: ABC transporter permease [Bacillota bacterium]